MNRMMKVLAIAALVVTIAGAGAVLYGVNTLVPVVEHVSVVRTPAGQEADAFQAVKEQAALGTFSGRVFAGTDGVAQENAAFVTVSVRLRNRGFFPAEWISLSVSPREDAATGAHDVLQLDNYGANVLAPGSRGDIAATVLTTLDPGQDGSLTLEACCYVLGEKHTFRIAAQ